MTITYAVIALGALALLFGLILGYASIRFKVDADPLVDQIDEVLPQTQCEEDVKKVAFIREDECIGCTKCIQACPVDAILGAAKHMHTVIAEECTGCDLCVDPCPVDCIDMVPVTETTATWKWDFSSSPKGDIPIKMVS